ncbi:nucleotidyltransferase domain-containing protein [Halochromatium glycolicum]|jgi:predicted nucleotidyltransferase|uniref:DNA polymerase III subunit beta n=1 Tax=Halochromatium glycolicum TaxID=85075 RepID=A0AAJ0UAI4_9GAMM|nr:nucleotidyltransferase domain-containing protein [Halochromatium glycolicum]MBK1707425.1 DNA polymerase III subunit beta [Halochromatium glycolicum]
MKPPPSEAVPDVFAREVRRRLGTHLKDLRLFGSRARGDAQPHSDYDMLVIVDRRSPDIRDAILEIEVDLIDRYEALVTSIVRTEDEWKQRQGTPLALNIEREGRRL